MDGREGGENEGGEKVIAITDTFRNQNSPCYVNPRSLVSWSGMFSAPVMLKFNFRRHGRECDNGVSADRGDGEEYRILYPVLVCQRKSNFGGGCSD